MKFQRIYSMVTTIILMIALILVSSILLKYDSPVIVKLINIIKNDEEQKLSTYELEEYKVKIKEEILDTHSRESLKAGYYCLGAIEYLLENYENAISYIEKSVEYIDIAEEGHSYRNSKEIDMMIYSALSSSYVLLGDLNKAEIYFERAKEFAIKNKMNEELSELYYGKAKAMLDIEASMEDVVELIRKSVEYTNDNKVKIRNDLFLGSIYKLKGEFKSSIEYTVAATNLAISSKDDVLVNKCIIRLGENYYVQENYLKTISIYELLIESGRLIDSENKLFVYGYLLHSYAQLGDYNQYQRYREMYMKVTEELEDRSRSKELAWLYITSACIEVDFSNVEKAKSNLEQARKLQLQDNSEMYYNMDLWKAYANIMINYNEDKDYDKALNGLELIISKNHERGVEIDITPIAIARIVDLSFENEDYSTLIKYMKIKEKFHDTSESQIYTDMAFNETNNFIKDQKIGIEKIKVGVLSLLIIGMIYALYNINEKKRQIVKLNLELEENNKLDSLTKVYNKGYLIKILHTLCNAKESVSFIMIDIDYFKKYNDNYGHINGDDALINVATVIKKVFKDDLVFRYGGEEFSVLSMGDREHVIKSINALQEEIYHTNIKHEYSSVSDRVTLSIGVSSLRIETKDQMTNLIKLADENLYKAKEEGRNRAKYEQKA